MGLTKSHSPSEFQDASGTLIQYRKSVTNVTLHGKLTNWPRNLFVLYSSSGGEAASLLRVTPSGATARITTRPKSNLAIALNEIAFAFGLNRQELARVCRVNSRKTLYNWINEEAEPRKSAMNRVFDLVITTRDWVSSGFPADRRQLHEPTLGRQSVFDGNYIEQCPNADSRKFWNT